MEIEIYGFHRALRGVFWACHRGVDQPKVGSATVVVEFLEFVAFSHYPVAHAGVIWTAPPVPQRCVWNIQPSAICSLGF